MKIYFAHPKEMDYKRLYSAIRKSPLNSSHEIILPHEKSSKPFKSRECLKKCGLVIAEVSLPSTGTGIELGWASAFGVPVICVFKKGSKVSGSLREITDRFLEYSDYSGLVSGISKMMRE